METFKKIKEIAKANKNGFTFSILENSEPKSGYCVAMNLTQHHFGDEGLKKVIEIAKNSTFVVGGWFNDEDKQFYYDCVMIEQDKETAIRLGKANKQISIYDLNKGQVIDLM